MSSNSQRSFVPTAIFYMTDNAFNGIVSLQISPSSTINNLQCLECFVYWRIWIQNPLCQKDYLLEEKMGKKNLFYEESNVYTFNDG